MKKIDQYIVKKKINLKDFEGVEISVKSAKNLENFKTLYMLMVNIVF